MKLHVRQLREGAGTPIVLLHGWMGCGADFELVAASSEFVGRAVFAIDLPGHGESPDYDREYDFSDAAAWIATALPAQTVDLVGYSMGGRLALYVAGTQPGRVRRLVLIGAHPGIEHPVEQRDRLEADSDRAAELVADPMAFLEAWGRLELFGPSDSAAWLQVAARRGTPAAGVAFSWARALVCLSLGRQLSLWNVPYGLTLPTLYVVGSRDEKFVDVAREFKAQNPTVTSIALIVGAHHAAHLDRPDAVAARLASFLNVAAATD